MLAVAKSNARLEAMKARILFNSRHKNDESVIAKIDFEIKPLKPKTPSKEEDLIPVK